MLLQMASNKYSFSKIRVSGPTLSQTTLSYAKKAKLLVLR